MSKPRPPRSDRPLVRRREDQPLPHLRSRPPLTGRNEGLGNITIGRVRARRGRCGHRPDGIGNGWRTPRTDRPAGRGNDLHPAGVVFHARLIAAIVAAVGVPIIAQTFLFPTLGLVWQGRYGMPLTVGVVLIAGIALDETPCSTGRSPGG